MSSAEQPPEKKIDYRLIQRLLTYLQPYKGWIIVVTILSIVSSALGPYRPRLIKHVIDDYVAQHITDGFIWQCLVILGVVLLQSTLQYTLTFGMQWVGQRVLYDIRMQIFDHILRLPFKIIDKTPVGRLVTRVTNDVEALNELFSSGVVLIFSDIMVILWILFFMFALEWRLALYTISVVPLLLFAASIFRKKVRVVYGKIRIQIARMNSFLNEYITGIMTVQLFGQEKNQYEKFDEINTEHTKLQLQSINYYATFFPVVELLSSVAICVVLYKTADIIGLLQTTGLQGKEYTGTLVAFLMYAEMFFRPVRDLTEKYNTLQSAATASERIFELLDTPLEQQHQNTQNVKPLEQEIEFRNVTFSYDDTRDVLKNVSFSIKKGQTVAIVGATGSGKSTIINLLCRFYDYQQGQILIDGVDIREFDARQHRSRIALVLQDVFLFSRSVEENIKLGRERVSNEIMNNTIHAIGAGFVDNLPEGYQTQVMERGATLSTGEKQLISFARAVVDNPDILILDEATSSIDTKTELMIEKAIVQLLEGRTSLVIAHRLSTIQRADSIIVLHHGEIAEIGNHDKLLKLNGLYKKLYTLQYAQEHHR
ncbi:MAG: ABC transporter ATP-binding protein [Candidatus Kapabacteria bacterium]|nr:ABC transporter ATP-binding protein [Candidatus Kapabacteria bacterium]